MALCNLLVGSLGLSGRGLCQALGGSLGGVRGGGVSAWGQGGSWLWAALWGCQGRSGAGLHIRTHAGVQVGGLSGCQRAQGGRTEGGQGLGLWERGQGVGGHWRGLAWGLGLAVWWDSGHGLGLGQRAGLRQGTGSL